MLTRFVPYVSRAAAAEALATRVAGELEAALRLRPHATLAVPGGSTPEPFLRALAEYDLDWARVVVLPGDERWVAADDVRANIALLERAFAGTPAAAATRLSLLSDAPTPEAGSAEVAARLSGVLGQPPRLDVAVVGLGTDGHTASLFPGGDHLADALDPAGRALVLPMRAPDAPEPRITLTLPVLAGAGALHVLAFGAEKRAILERAAASPPDAFPISAVAHAAGRAPTIHWAP